MTFFLLLVTFLVCVDMVQYNKPDWLQRYSDPANLQRIKFHILYTSSACKKRQRSGENAEVPEGT